MQKKLVTLLRLLIVFTTLSLCSGAQEPGHTVTQKQLLAAAPCLVKDKQKLFLLTKEAIEPVKKIRDSHDRLIFFTLKRSEVKPDQPLNQTGETIWQRFSYFDVGSGTHPWHMAALESDANGERIYVILATSYQYKFFLEIYEIDPLRPRQPELIPKFNSYGLSSLNYENQEKPASSFKKEFPIGECGVNRIDTILERDHLLIYADRRDRTCSPVYFRYDLKTKQWSEVTLQESSNR